MSLVTFGLYELNYLTSLLSHSTLITFDNLGQWFPTVVSRHTRVGMSNSDQCAGHTMSFKGRKTVSGPQFLKFFCTKHLFITISPFFKGIFQRLLVYSIFKWLYIVIKRELRAALNKQKGCIRPVSRLFDKPCTRVSWSCVRGAAK